MMQWIQLRTMNKARALAAGAMFLLMASSASAQVRYDAPLFDWSDNTAAGWTLGGVSANLKTKGGLLFFEVRAGLNRLQSPDNLGLSADDYSHVDFELRNKSGAGQATLYFITNEDTSWNAAKSVAIPMATHDFFNRRYVLELPAVPGQTLKRFRIELTANAGEQGIVYCDSFDIHQGSGKHTWNWNQTSDTLGWTLDGTATGLDISGGLLSFTSTGNDPTLTSPNNLTFEANSVNTLIVRFKNTSSLATAALYWIRSDAPGFSAPRVKTFPIVANDPGFTTYAVDLSGEAAWTGTITRLRLDLPQGESSGALNTVDWIDLQYAGELPKPDADNARYYLTLQRGFMTGGFPDYRFQELVDQMGAGKIYTKIGSGGIIEPTVLPSMAGGLPRFRQFDLFYAPIFTIPLSGSQRDLLEATDLREFQWRLNGQTWSGTEMVEDWGGDRNYKRVSYSRLAPIQKAYEEDRARSWAQDMLAVMQGYEERVPLFNLLVESELPSGGETDLGQLGDYSPYAITEFRDWLRHTGIYDATSGKFAGEGAPETIVGSLIGGRSPFYDDPTPADANGTGASFNSHFGTGFTSWTLRYWDLIAFPAAITDTNFVVKPVSGTGYTAGGFDAPRVRSAGNAFWQAWSWDTFDQGGAYNYPAGNPDNPAFGFRQHLVRNFGRDMFNIMVEEGLPADHIFLHQIPGEFINAGRQRSGATPIWTGYLDNGMLGLTRFGTVPDIGKMLQYVNLTHKRNRGWGFFEWHPKPANSTGTLRDTAAYIEDSYTTTFSELGKLVPNRMRAVTPGWWDFSGAGFNWNKFPTYQSGMVEAIKAFSAQYPDVPFWHQGPDVPDYTPPQVEKLIALSTTNASMQSILIGAEIWSEYRNTWSQWGGLDHFAVEQRSDGGAWGDSQAIGQAGEVLFSNRVTGVLYEYRVRAISGTGKVGAWSDPFNWATADFDNDGLPDSAEGSGDPDGDGLANYEDLDSDNDSQSDAQEAATGRNPYDGIFESGFNTDGYFEGWVPDQLGNAVVAGGILRGFPTSNDPKLTYSNGLQIPGNDVAYIIVRMKKSSWATGNGEYYWKNEDGNFDSYRRGSFSTVNDGQFHTYFLSPATDTNATNWMDKTISGLRLDPNTVNDGSIIEIDYILFSDGDFDNDGIPDLVEGGDNDADGDGLSAWEDLDSDNDGVPDAPPPPPVPTGLSATPGAGRIDISWTASTGATGYKVSTSNSVTHVVEINPVALSPYAKTGLDNGTLYYVAVAATSNGSESAYSAPVGATPFAPDSDSDGDGDGMNDTVETALARNPYNAVDMAFHFDADGDFQGWTNNPNNVSGLMVSNGVLSGSAVTADPFFANNSVAFLSSEVAAVSVRMRAGANASVQLYWAPEGGGFAGNNANQSYAGGGAWRVLEFVLAGNAGWDGKIIDKLRIDPIASAGAWFEIDWIRSTNGDADNDGFPDTDEIIAGTDRLDPAADAFLISEGGLPIHVDGKTGRLYSLQRSDSLTPVSWGTVETAGPLPSDQTVVFTNGTPSTNGFYRVLVELP